MNKEVHLQDPFLDYRFVSSVQWVIFSTVDIVGKFACRMTRKADIKELALVFPENYRVIP